MSIEKILHYTSNEAWNKIQEERYLIPKTPLVGIYCDNTERLMLNEKGIAGIPNNYINNWVEYGLMEYITEHTTGEVLLEIDISESANILIRDHTLCSPKGFTNKYGTEGSNYFSECYSGLKKTKGPAVTRIMAALKNYFRKEIPIEKYTDQFTVPEAWILEPIPISKIKRIK